MNAFFKKLSRLERRKREVEKELCALRSRRRVLDRQFGRRGAASAPELRDHEAAREGDSLAEPARSSTRSYASTPAPAAKKSDRLYAQQTRKGRERDDKVRDTRFVDYLSGSLDAGCDLHYERKTQRNRAILMLILALIALIGLLVQVFF